MSSTGTSLICQMNGCWARADRQREKGQTEEYVVSRKDDGKQAGRQGCVCRVQKCVGRVRGGQRGPRSRWERHRRDAAGRTTVSSVGDPWIKVPLATLATSETCVLLPLAVTPKGHADPPSAQVPLSHAELGGGDPTSQAPHVRLLPLGLTLSTPPPLPQRTVWDAPTRGPCDRCGGRVPRSLSRGCRLTPQCRGPPGLGMSPEALGASDPSACWRQSE